MIEQNYVYTVFDKIAQNLTKSDIMHLQNIKPLSLYLG